MSDEMSVEIFKVIYLILPEIRCGFDFQRFICNSSAKISFRNIKLEQFQYFETSMFGKSITDIKQLHLAYSKDKWKKEEKLMKEQGRSYDLNENELKNPYISILTDNLTNKTFVLDGQHRLMYAYNNHLRSKIISEFQFCEFSCLQASKYLTNWNNVKN